MKTVVYLLATSAVIAITALQAQEASKSPAATSSDSIAAAPKSPANVDAASAQWLRGKWAFDEEHTQKKYAEAKKPDGLGALAEGLVYPQLVEKLKGSQLSVTEKEVVMTTKDGNGKAFAYEVLEAPNANSVTLKQTDGEVTTYHREKNGEADRFWIASTGNVNVPFYFKRAH